MSTDNDGEPPANKQEQASAPDISPQQSEGIRDELGRIKPGHSLNPSGRPKVAGEVRRIIEEHGPKAARKIGELIDNEDPKIAIAASKDVIDRLLGKPRNAEDDQQRSTLAAFFAGMMSRTPQAEAQAAADEAEDGEDA